MLRTRFCDLVGIDVPIVCAPMGFITGVELAAAVSNAGGLGVMSAGATPPAVLRRQIRQLREMTLRPFGVNVLLFTAPGGMQRPVGELVQVCIEERVPIVSCFWGDCSRYVGLIHAAGLKVMDQVGSLDAARRSKQAGVDIIVAQGTEAGGMWKAKSQRSRWFRWWPTQSPLCP